MLCAERKGSSTQGCALRFTRATWEGLILLLPPPSGTCKNDEMHLMLRVVLQ